MKKTNGKKQSHKTNGKQQQQIRMDDNLKARIRRYQEKVHGETGLEVNFSTVVRTLIEKTLDAEKIP